MTYTRTCCLPYSFFFFSLYDDKDDDDDDDDDNNNIHVIFVYRKNVKLILIL